MISKVRVANGLAQKLRELRKEFELSQKDLAKIIGVSRSAYTYYETGKARPKMEVLAKIADLYGVSVQVFFDCLK